MEQQDDEIHPIAKGLIFVVAGLFLIYSLWCNVLAFTGGTLPVVGIHLQGGIVSGFLWLIFADPIMLTVGYWIGMIVVVPVAALIAWLSD